MSRTITALGLLILASAYQVRAQSRVAHAGDTTRTELLARRAGLVVTGIPVADALGLLQERSGVPIAFSRTLLPSKPSVSCRCESVAVGEALDSLLQGLPFMPSVQDGQIVVVPRPKLLEDGPSRVETQYVGVSHLEVRPLGAMLSHHLEVQQPRPIRGTVADERGRGISGATVSVVGAQTRAVTDADGRFQLDASGADVTLRVVAIGYRPLTQTVRTGTTEVQLALAAAAVNLDEMVVTGTPGATQKRAIGNAVTSVNVSEVVALAPVQTTEQLISGRAPGVIVNNAIGTAGSGSRILIRGPASLSFDGNPIIYVDGVRVNNDVVRAPPGQQAASARRTAAVSRINDFAPEEIESIEIVKGPAASTLYGTEASNGVIQIITKKGRAGRSALNLRVKQGAAAITNAEDRFPWRYFKNPTSRQVDSMNSFIDAKAFGISLARTGWLQGYGAELSGGTDITRYHLGGSFDREEGTMPTNAVNRFTGNANITIAPKPSIDVSASLGLNVTGAEFPGASYLQMLFRPNPQTRSGPTRGYPAMPPEVDTATRRHSQDVRRYTGSVTINHRPVSWLSQRLTVGADLTNEENVALFPLVPDQYAQFFTPISRLGSKSIDRKDATYSTVDYSGTVTWAPTKRIESSTSVGAQYYRKVDHFEALDGQQFPSAGVTAVAGAAIRTSSEDLIENTTLGLYVQQQFSLNSRLFVTGALRADDNSAFGANFDLVTYPKISASWVLSEEPFFKLPFVNTLRVRGAFGESGQQPASFAAIRTYLPIAGAGDVATGTPQFVGNPDLGPERGREIEAGFEAGLFGDRVGVDFTYYNRSTKDAIVQRNVAPSTGFPGVQLVNAGEVRNKGIEVLIRGRPIESQRLDWDLSLNIGTNANEIVNLGIPNTTFLAVGFLPNRHQPGYPVGAYFQRRIVSADLDANGRAINIMCDPGPTGTAPVACAQAPPVFIGPTAAKAQGAATSTVTLFDRLRLYAQVDFKLGNYLFDANEFSGCAVGRNPITVFPDRYLPEQVAECQLGLGFVYNTLLQRASYAKLREISVAYTLPRSMTRVFRARDGLISLAARNIATWTGFRGIDPEVFTTDNFLASNHNQDMLPMPFLFTGTLRLSF